MIQHNFNQRLYKQFSLNENTHYKIYFSAILETDSRINCKKDLRFVLDSVNIPALFEIKPENVPQLNDSRIWPSRTNTDGMKSVCVWGGDR